MCVSIYFYVRRDFCMFFVVPLKRCDMWILNPWINTNAREFHANIWINGATSCTWNCQELCKGKESLRKEPRQERQMKYGKLNFSFLFSLLVCLFGFVSFFLYFGIGNCGNWYVNILKDTSHGRSGISPSTTLSELNRQTSG